LAFKVLQNGDLACGSDDYTKKNQEFKKWNIEENLKWTYDYDLALTVEPNSE
jgi:hypothetical protein